MMILVAHIFACDFCDERRTSEKEHHLGSAPPPVVLPPGWTITHGLACCPRHRVVVQDRATEERLADIPGSPLGR